MSTLLNGAFGYGLGVAAGKAIFGDDKPKDSGPIRQQTEAEIVADEKRFDEEAKRLADEDPAEKKSSDR